MKKFAVLGSGISYTLSPTIHNAVFDILGADAQYFVEDIPGDGLPQNIERLLGEYDGFNVTVPFKKDICQFITTDSAAVNTVIAKQRVGYNTDGYGFKCDLAHLTGGKKVPDALILGAGGAAEVVAKELLKAGTFVWVLCRHREKADIFARSVGASVYNGGSPRLIVNCTPIGWDGKSDALPPDIPTDNLKYAYDLIYPTMPSMFLRRAKAAGAATSDGLGMLIAQALRADELFLNTKIDYEAARKIAAQKIAEVRK